MHHVLFPKFVFVLYSHQFEKKVLMDDVLRTVRYGLEKETNNTWKTSDGFFPDALFTSRLYNRKVRQNTTVSRSRTSSWSDRVTFWRNN